MTVIGASVCFAAFALWAGLVGTLLTSSAGDPAGRGLAEAYAVFIAIALREFPEMTSVEHAYFLAAIVRLRAAPR